MTDERDYLDDEWAQAAPDGGGDWDDTDSLAEEFSLPTIEKLDEELAALEAYATPGASDASGEQPVADEVAVEGVVERSPDGEDDTAREEAKAVEVPDEPVAPSPEVFASGAAYAVAQDSIAPEQDHTQQIDSLAHDEKLRQPRAQLFRRNLRHKIGMFPLAAFSIALGLYLLAREHAWTTVPDFSAHTLVVFTVLAIGFTFVFHGFMFGRRERGLLFVGFGVWVTAAVLVVLILGIEPEPDWAEWWPILLWALGATLIVTFLVERTHDVRLVLLASYVLLGGGVAYWITSGEADQTLLDTVSDYWPLVLSVVGVGLLPVAFRARQGDG